MKWCLKIILLFLLIFLSSFLHADLYRIYEGAPNGATGNPNEWGFEQLSDAWTHATITNPGNHTIRIEWQGPSQSEGVYFEVPELVLLDSGDIEVIADTGIRPEIRPNGDHPVFSNNSTTGKVLKIIGYDEGVYNRIALYSAYSSPLIATSMNGNGVFIIEKVNFIKKERIWEPTEEPGAPNGNYINLQNVPVSKHQFYMVRFLGGDEVEQTSPLMVMGPMNGTGIMEAQLRYVDFSYAKGRGTRLSLKNIVRMTLEQCIFAPEGGSTYSESAIAMRADSPTASDGGSQVIFYNCSFRSGGANLFDKLGEDTHTTPNVYRLYMPVFTGSCGERAFNLQQSGARVEILGLEPGNDWFDTSDDIVPSPIQWVDMDGLTSNTGTYARILRGSIKFYRAKGIIRPYVGYAITCLGGELTGPVEVEMDSCWWGFGAGTFRSGATSGNYAPILTMVNTIFYGGGVPSYIDTRGFSDTLYPSAYATVRLRHVTLTSPESNPVTNWLIHGRIGDTLYSAATIFDSPNASNITPVWETGFEWKNLAWNRNSQDGKGGFETAPNEQIMIYADPKLDDVGKLQTGSGALGRSGTTDTTNVDFEGQNRPLPPFYASPDIGADEGFFNPTNIISNPEDMEVMDNVEEGTIVGEFTVIDPDPEEPHTLSLVQNGNGAFRLDGNQLVVDLPSALNGSENPYVTVQVWATDLMGLHYDKTFLVHVIDATPAYVVSVTVTQPLEVEVEFSEPMRIDELGELNNYSISGDGKGTLTENPSQVTLLDNKHVRLNWNSGEMKNGGDVTITVNNVFDAQGNPIGSPNSATHAGSGLGGFPPQLVSIEIKGPRLIHVIFSEAMRELGDESVFNPANYHWWFDTPPGNSPTNVGKVAEFPPTYAISWTTGSSISEGQEVTVRVDNVQDLAGNPIDPLHNTASDTFEITLPRALSLTAVNEQTLKIKYSKEMGSSVFFVGNYTLSNPPGASGKGTLSIHPSRVVQDTDPMTYILEWDSGEMKAGSLVQIEVENVRDTFGNLIDPQFNKVTCPSIGVSPFVTDVSIVDSRNIRVFFSEPMEAFMTIASRYSLSGPGKGTLNTSPDTVQKIEEGHYLLKWNAGNLTEGEDITITVNTGADLAGNGLVEPKSKTVTNRIKILSYVIGGNYYIGDTVTLSFNVSGGIGGLNFQWLKNGGTPVGPNSNEWTITNIDTTYTGSYRCQVGDSREEIVFTNYANLGIYPHMQFLLQPGPATVMDGDTYTLRVEVSGGIPELSYQWKKDGENIGENYPEFTITEMSPEDEGTYWVEVSDEKEVLMSTPVEIKYDKGLPISNLTDIIILIVLISLSTFITSKTTRLYYKPVKVRTDIHKYPPEK
ncbi:MAG TPA: immunoglobulin domain-containing protein [Candidatus Hydrogenedens sp.]|nr:immunoglobulin domain-containing protein [Candidatus Hydrogenedens sp.]